MLRDQIITFATTRELKELLEQYASQCETTVSTVCHQTIEEVYGETIKERK